MYIKKIKISDYKYVNSPEPIQLKPGFNVIIGQNNAGKTALQKMVYGLS